MVVDPVNNSLNRIDRLPVIRGSEKEIAFKKATRIAMCVFGGALLVLGASTALLVPLGLTGVIIGVVVGSILSTGLIISTLVHFHGYKYFQGKSAQKKSVEEGSVSSSGSTKKETFTEDKSIVSEKQELEEIDEARFKEIEKFINEKGKSVQEKRLSIRTNIALLEKSQKQLSDKLSDKESELGMIERNIQTLIDEQKETGKEVEFFQEKKKELMGEIKSIEEKLSDIQSEQFISIKQEANVLQGVKNALYMEKKQKKEFYQEKQRRLEEKMSELKNCREELQAVEEEIAKAIIEKQKIDTALLKAYQDLTGKKEFVIALLKEEGLRLEKMGHLLQKEQEKLNLLTRDLESLEGLKTLLEKSEQEIAISALPELEEAKITAVDISDMLQGPLLSSFSLDTSEIEEESFVEVKRILKAPRQLKIAKKVIHKRKISIKYQLWSDKATDMEFVANSMKEKKLATNMTELFQKKGAKFVQKIMKLSHGFLEEMGKDIVAYGTPLVESDLLGFLNKFYKMIEKENPLHLLHALMTNKALQKSIQPVIKELSVFGKKSIAKQMKIDVKDLMPEDLWLMNVFTIWLNSLVSGLFINHLYSEKEINGFCNAVSISTKELQQHVEKGTLMTEILHRILEDSDIEVPGIKEITNFPGNLTEVLQQIKEAQAGKSIQAKINIEQVKDLFVTHHPSFKSFCQSAPHLLKWAIYGLNKIEIPKIAKPLVMNVLNISFIQAIGRSFLKTILVGDLFTDEEISVFAHFLGVKTEALVHGIRDASFIPLIAKKLFSQSKKKAFSE